MTLSALRARGGVATNRTKADVYLVFGSADGFAAEVIGAGFRKLTVQVS
jgi:hypothetical protein